MNFVELLETLDQEDARLQATADELLSKYDALDDKETPHAKAMQALGEAHDNAAGVYYVKRQVLLHQQAKAERDQLLEMTRSLDEHPEDYNGPCECKVCMSYAG